MSHTHTHAHRRGGREVCFVVGHSSLLFFFFFLTLPNLAASLLLLFLLQNIPLLAGGGPADLAQPAERLELAVAELDGAGADDARVEAEGLA